MSDSPTPRVRTCDTAVADLKARYDTYSLSWRDFAKKDPYKGMPPGTLNAIYHGAPVPKKWYEQLGIPPEVTITPVNGHHIPEGTQVFTALTCIKPDCRISFVPNTAKRRQCYNCQKVRVRKRT